MPTFDDALFSITQRQTFLGQNIVNVFYYAHVDGTPDITLALLVSEFFAEVALEIIKIQAEGVEGVDLTGRREDGATEVVQDLTGVDGIRVGTEAPSFNAWGYIFNRSNIDVRNGGKRFAGVVEADTDGNGPAIGIVPDLDDLAVVLGAILTMSNGSEARPVIFRRGSLVDGSWIGTTVASAAFRSLTSQTTRKATPA